MGEFELIRRFFPRSSARADVVLGVGDDAALVDVPAGDELVVAADTLVSGVHFPVDFDPEHVGYRALAVNLSDMAAMGADPAWFTLCLTLPGVDERWLEGFSRGLLKLAEQHGVALIGGDTTSGPLTISVQILGCAPTGRAIRRSGAQPGDVVCLSGTVGDAAGGLRVWTDGSGREAGAAGRYLIDRFTLPTPRVDLGRRLRGIATAAIDVSDGLAADVGKLAEASGVAVRLNAEALPLSSELVQRFGPDAARSLALAGGDDYELCFTVPPAGLDSFRRARGELIYAIGTVEKGRGVSVIADGQPLELGSLGYDHFAR